MNILDLIWPTIAVLVTIAIFSFLFKDNPVYKFAEHIFIGLNVGYLIVIDYRNVVIPKIIIPLRESFSTHTWSVFFITVSAVMVGLLYITRFSKKHVWMSRYPIAIYIGFYSGYAIVASFQASILQQLYGTVIDNNTQQPIINGQKFVEFFNNPTGKSLIEALNGPIFVVGVLFVLIYFFFSIKNENPIVRFSNKPALLMLMLAFGAAFGYTFMGRISLFIGRMNFIFGEWWGMLQSTFGG